MVGRAGGDPYPAAQELALCCSASHPEGLGSQAKPGDRPNLAGPWSLESTNPSHPIPPKPATHHPPSPTSHLGSWGHSHASPCFLFPRIRKAEGPRTRSSLCPADLVCPPVRVSDHLHCPFCLLSVWHIVFLFSPFFLPFPAFAYYTRLLHSFIARPHKTLRGRPTRPGPQSNRLTHRAASRLPITRLTRLRPTHSLSILKYRQGWHGQCCT